MKQGWVVAVLLLVGGCTAPQPVPTDDFARPLEHVTPDVTTIDMQALDAVDPGLVYVVRRGDTLFSIAWRFEQDVSTLKARNELASDQIRVGQRIKLKGPVPEPSPAPVAAPPQIKPVPTEPPPAVAKAPAQKPVTQSAQRKPKPVQATPVSTGWQWPVNGPVLEAFSERTRFSRSLQLGGDQGAPVKAAAAGRVVYAGDGLVGFGNLVIVSHEGNYLSAYGHNDRLLVNVGDVVRRGQTIAAMGSTGTDRVKLHFEIRKDGSPINPLDVLPARD